MITLFRRIRQKLIDSGSVTKYLLYAAGEILLVVIGIMIALQINNWNEDRKNRRYEITMLRQVNDALEIDHRNILSNIAYLKQVQYSIYDITRMKNDPALPRDSLYEHFDLVAGYGTSFIANRSPFEAIESGGLDKISDPQIRNALSTLYGFSLLSTEGWINEVLRNELFKRNTIKEQIFGYKMVPGENYRIENKLVADDVEALLDHPKMDVYLYTSGWALPATISLMERSEVQMREMMDLINEETGE